MPALQILPCLDSNEVSAILKHDLLISDDRAVKLGKEALDAIRSGFYTTVSGSKMDWSSAIQSCIAAKVSVPPTVLLPEPSNARFTVTHVQVANETTLAGSARLVMEGLRPLALNFTNGIHPGGGFLSGARAQEETLCRSSALYASLEGDAMYEAHKKRSRPDSTDWAILSPSVPVFRSDDGTALEKPWLLDIITCAAPVATRIGRAESAILMDKRIRRVLAIARSYGYESLVLGAWGCGAFGNDGNATAASFKEALENDFAGAFTKVVFSITDWSAERRFLSPFKDIFDAT